MKRRSLSAVLVAVVALVLTALGVTPASAATVRTFQSPSHNVFCSADTYSGSWYLRCDILSVAKLRKRPKSCPLDYGHAFGVTPRGKGRALCVGDTAADPHYRVARYGSTVRMGPFTCSVTKARVQCKNRARHGFTLSRKVQRTF